MPDFVVSLTFETTLKHPTIQVGTSVYLDELSALQAQKDKETADRQKSSVGQTTTKTLTIDKIALMTEAGISPSDFDYVDYIITHESGWNPNARNGSACGLAQQKPCGKWTHQWNDPVGALIDGNDYVKSRYGSWANAVSWWKCHNWY